MPPSFSTLFAIVTASAVSVGFYMLVLYAYVRLWRRRKRGDYPFKDRYLRGPGHTLEKTLRDLDRKLLLHCIVAAFGPLLAIAFAPKPDGHVSMPLTFALASSVFASNCVWSIRVLRRFSNVRLGLAAERMTGQELDQVRVPGTSVFHDVPLERCGNIDHVVVAPAGVFAVETKAHRRPVQRTENGYKVKTDGQRLFFPGYTDSKAIEQAKKQAEALCRELQGRGLRPGKVRPVVALPGWYVLSNDPKAGAWVLNPKNLGAWIAERPSVLSAAEVAGISRFLDERCRDVEIE